MSDFILLQHYQEITVNILVMVFVRQTNSQQRGPANPNLRLFCFSSLLSLSHTHTHTHTGASGKFSANVENFTSGSSSSTWFDHLLPFHEACWTQNSSLLMKRPRARVTWGQRGFPSTMSLLGCLRNPQTG